RWSLRWPNAESRSAPDSSAGCGSKSSRTSTGPPANKLAHRPPTAGRAPGGSSSYPAAAPAADVRPTGAPLSPPAALMVLASLPAAAPARTPAREAETLFELKVRPVLANTCFPCHGGKKVGGKLRVDSRAALLRGGESGPAVVPGDPDRS